MLLQAQIFALRPGKGHVPREKDQIRLGMPAHLFDDFKIHAPAKAVLAFAFVNVRDVKPADGHADCLNICALLKLSSPRSLVNYGCRHQRRETWNWA